MEYLRTKLLRFTCGISLAHFVCNLSFYHECNFLYPSYVHIHMCVCTDEEAPAYSLEIAACHHSSTRLPKIQNLHKQLLNVNNNLEY